MIRFIFRLLYDQINEYETFEKSETKSMLKNLQAHVWGVQVIGLSYVCDSNAIKMLDTFWIKDMLIVSCNILLKKIADSTEEIIKSES